MFKREGFYHYYFYNILHVLFFLQMLVYPIFYIDNFMMVNMLQMLIVLTIIGYCFYNGLALGRIGIILRIFSRMVYVVVIFALVSMVLLTAIAFPIHSLFVDFSQSSNGTELNMFRSLYNGVLTLFEFVFGAVVFVRPYNEQDVSTYLMTFFMVIFSFFGNIMMANMLIAFLSRQFESITRKAKYFTREMQFGLVKIFNMRELDTMFTMPYPFVGLALPFYLVMAICPTKRQAMNLFLRKVIHIINIFIPTFLIMNVFIIVLIPIRYAQLFFRLLLKVPVRFSNFFYILLWLIGGPFLLLKLYCLDVGTMLKIMLDLGAEGEDLLSTDLEPKALENTIKTFKKIIRAALYHIEFFDRDKEDNTNPKGNSQPVKERKVEIGKLMQLMGLYKQHKKIMEQVAKNLNVNIKNVNEKPDSDSESEGDSKDSKDPDDVGMSFSSKYSAVYSQAQEVLVKVLLKKFATHGNQMEVVENLKVDLDFMLKRVKHNVNLENVHRLIGFDKTTLVRASKLIRKTNEASVMTEITNLRESVQKLDHRVEEVVHDLSTVRELHLQLFEILSHKLSK